MRSVLKLVLIWLLLNVCAGFFAGLLFLPFKGTTGLEEHSGFIVKLLIGGGLFGFVMFSGDNQGSGLLAELFESKFHNLVLAVKYLLFYILGFAVILLVLTATAQFLIPSIGTSEGHILDGQDFLRFKELRFSVYGGATLYLIGVCLVAPVVEEVFYRKLMYVELRKTLAPAASIAVTALFFGVFHPNILIAALDGAYLSFVYERERSLQVNVILHSFLNILIIAVMSGIYFL